MSHGMEQAAIDRLREMGTERGANLAMELERGRSRREATEPQRRDGGEQHEYGTQERGRFCSSCSYPSQWKCFTCRTPLCFECVKRHVPASQLSYVGSRAS